MTTSKPISIQSMLLSRRDLEFVLYELLHVDTLTTRPRYADHTRETFDAAIDVTAKIAEEQFATHNKKIDQNEPTFDGKRVMIIPEVKAALDAYCSAGLMAAAHDYELGGMQLPYVVTQACFAHINAANIATAAYPLLTTANANLINAWGSEEQKATYLPHLLSGRFFGTMCLTETQAGSSLADTRTRAEPQPDGGYRLYGSKMWISAGEHELSENIVHLVLAKIPGSPPGVKGISLFIAPKYLVHPDGSLGERNDISLAGLNHKMGYRGTVNTVLNFGEKGGAIASLVGKPNAGLAYMFHMMNEARIGVGLGAVMLGYTGYLHALDYARKRPQGRPASGKDPLQPQIPIVGHADVRRMLLAQKAYVEGGLALGLYCALLVDEQRTAESQDARREAGLLLDVLTPIAKAWPSQWCLEANSLAIQVHGGYGYSREYNVEQFYRDNRLNPIHEGTNGIQAIDLLGRKVGMEGGAALQVLERAIAHSARQARACPSPELQRFGEQLTAAFARVTEVTQKYQAARDRAYAQTALANAHVFLEMAGHVTVAWIWLRQALVAETRLARVESPDADFYRGKLQACRYFFRWELPKTEHWHRLLNEPDSTCEDMQDEWF
ncbi:MAG: acyl-CoA dehydrogenase [Betaproteobacteria bacterium RIFCSPLOWO2_12_FULL_63_13]|nr:MAG: acyl-CoA dehydrogenase [Betaproteobacteria bacterium RIFCSPLOWO2_02_FULL_63_19]OGA45314.1 MAG: acyl-CoA dehydrogenase [Betaproteobacteria bacterium RIFCSPLOWO2_12_FULL_63_13]